MLRAANVPFRVDEPNGLNMQAHAQRRLGWRGSQRSLYHQLPCSWGQRAGWSLVTPIGASNTLLWAELQAGAGYAHADVRKKLENRRAMEMQREALLLSFRGQHASKQASHSELVPAFKSANVVTMRALCNMWWWELRPLPERLGESLQAACL
jgi:hypothetical protein